MEHKTGCYLCEGCGISDVLDMDRLEKVAKKAGCEVVKTMAKLCSKDALDEIKADLDGGLEAACFGACSHREHAKLFDFPGKIIDRVPLRDRVAWSLDPEDDTYEEVDECVNLAGEDYLRFGLIRTEKSTVPTGYQVEEMNRAILVIGGGVTGLTAALDVANAGYDVVLVEKSASLGGWATKFAKNLPRSTPMKGYVEPNIAEKIDAVQKNDRIAIHLNSTVESVAGAPGMFDVKITSSGSATDAKIGSIIVAAGWKPYDTSKISERFALADNPNVITNIELEEMIAKGEPIARPSDGKPAQTVVFVAGTGSDEDDYIPYCSNVTDMVALKQADYLKEKNPEANAYMFYKDMRTPGLYELMYKKAQKDGVIFVKGTIEGIGEGDEMPLALEATDSLLGEPLMMEADLVVIATGMVPTTLDENVLNLTYRQGPELPERNYGYPNSHFICFPYETQRTAIYAAGAVRSPMDMTQSCEDASGAAMKAIQAIELISRGEATHPRVGDLTYPNLFLQRCTQCKRCTEECPFGALDEDEKGTPKLNPTRCRRCGVCMGACPERIISFENYSVDMIGSQIKSMSMPDEFDEMPRILVLMCENDAYPALDMASANKIKHNPYVRVIPMRCLGSLNLVWIADALAKGVDGVYVIGCKSGDDYQCHFVKGSELAKTRLEKVSETLERLLLESERIRFEEVNITDYATLPQKFDEFLEELGEFDPNPYKE